jgi:hypothetical protein
MSGHALYFQMGAGSQVLGGDTPHCFVSNNTSEAVTNYESFPVWQDVPSGTQMQVRAKNSTTSPQDSGVALYAVTG